MMKRLMKFIAMFKRDKEPASLAQCIDIYELEAKMNYLDHQMTSRLN